MQIPNNLICWFPYEKRGRKISLSHMVFNPFGPQSLQPLGRVLPQSLDHHNQVAPLHRIRLLLRIIIGKTEPAGLKPFDIHPQTAVLGMDKFHEPAAVA